MGEIQPVKQLNAILYENAVDIIKNDLYGKLKKVDEILEEDNLEALSNVIDKISPIGVADLDEDLFEMLTEGLDRYNYNFPSILKIGTLKTWQSSPSKIIPGEQFYSGIPFYAPIGSNGIGVFDNQNFKKEISTFMETTIIKTVSALPTALSKLTVIDKNGSGQSFPSLLELHEKITSGKFLSEDSEIESEMLELKHSMTVVTQSITSNGFDSVEDYNKNTEEIAQAYKIIAISGFPTGFTKKAAESLLSILEAGTNSGIHVFMTFASDPKHGLSQKIQGIPLSDFTKHLNMFEFSLKVHEFMRLGFIDKQINLFSVPLKNAEDFKQLTNNRFKIVLESAKKKTVKSIVAALNHNIQDVNIRPVISLSKTIPNKFWTDKAGMGICVPFAKSGIENIYLSLGVNSSGEAELTHHGMVGGSTGSGKTVMLHDMILHGSMKYSPDQLCFWLLDYKEGTEFAVYKDFPYVQILSMESEVEFGQQVLQNALDIISARGVLFKNEGVSNLVNYNKKMDEQGKKPLQRIIVIIDEFQALFPKNPRVTALTNMLIDDFLRRGRSFGVNLLLATQTLKGIDLEENLLSNMPIRIALKMDVKDSAKLFGDDNQAPRFLENPGEGIYNKAFGNSTSNVHFQAFFASNEAVDDTIEIVNKHIEDNLTIEQMRELYEARFVYNGDTPGKIENNKILVDLQKKASPLPEGVVYIGESAGLSKVHTSFLFETDFADNLLIVGDDISKALSTIILIAKQLEFQDKKTQIHICNFNKKFKDRFERDFNKEMIYDNRTADSAIESIFEEYTRRKSLSEEDLVKEPIIYLASFFIDSALMFTDQSRANTLLVKFKEMLKDCSEYSIHLIVYATNFNMIMTADLTQDLDKFKKKIAFKGGNSIKIFGEAGSSGLISFSKSNKVGIGSFDNMGDSFFKFKPYIIEDDFEITSLKDVVEEELFTLTKEAEVDQEELISEYEREDDLPRDILLADGSIVEDNLDELEEEN